MNTLLTTIENLSLVVKGNLDNAEPLFAVGGLVARKTHYFANVVNVKRCKLAITDDLKARIKNGCGVALLLGDNFDNEAEIVNRLNPTGVAEFFDDLRRQVNEYYGV